MTDRGTALGLFERKSDAKAALRRLREGGFRMSAALYCSDSGKLTVDGYAGRPLLCALLGAAAVLAIVAVGILLGLIRLAHTGVATATSVVVTGLAVGVSLGSLFAAMSRFRGYGQEIGIFARWVLKGESLVLVQPRPGKLTVAIDALRQTGGREPLIFALHPRSVRRPVLLPELLRNAPLPVDRLLDEATALAKSLSSAPPPPDRIAPLRPRLQEVERDLQNVIQVLGEAPRMGQAVSMSAEWLLDSSHILQSHLADVYRNLSRRFYEELPMVSAGPNQAIPRICAIASALVDFTDARLERENIRLFLHSFQGPAALTMGELWALPQILILRLLESIRAIGLQVLRRQAEGELADFVANRLLTAARRHPDQLLGLLANLAEEHPQPSAHFIHQLIGHLYDENTAVTPVRDWAEHIAGSTLPDIVQQEHRVQAAEQLSLANAITSLRQMLQLDWRSIFESVSRVDGLLWLDPTGIYSRMDFDTRDRYRHAIERISRRSKISEVEVATHALNLAEAATDSLRQHVGYYLIDDGRILLEAELNCKPPLYIRLGRWLRRHHAPLYVSAIGVITLAVTAAFVAFTRRVGVPPGTSLILGLLALSPAGDIAVEFVNYVLTRILQPKKLPRLSFEDEIPDEHRTLVVVPMMLLTPEAITEEVERLEVRYLANPDPNLLYGLLSDYSDAPEPHMPEDAERLDIVLQGIENLNRKYGARFFLFHRERVWSESEQCWMGWERKRGKLEQLIRLMAGGKEKALDNLLRVGDAAKLEGIQYILTLDSDTQLPPQTARMLVETMSHPLNRAVISEENRRMERGYAILQPRVSTSLPSATATRFARLFADSSGTDPYTHAVSDVYHDMSGEGNYHGKGLLDVHALNKTLVGRFPDAHLLSHDLIEGVHVRVGYTSDVELLDLFPSDYVGYSTRQHRWVRGDWQIIDWLFPRVRTSHGSAPNPLSLLRRWKIFDNLRRSLVPVFSILLLCAGWLISPGAAAAVSCLVAVALFFPPITVLFTHLTTRPRADVRDLDELRRAFARSAFRTALLVHQAVLSVDAICRVAYRRLVSHRLMLEWETAAETHRRTRNRHLQFVLQLGWIPVASFAIIMAAPVGIPALFAIPPFVALWATSPLLVVWLDLPVQRVLLQALSTSDRALLRRIARLTWQFFLDFVGPANNWLPPDNYQTRLRIEVALRTSPTNIAMALLSNLAAYDMGYSSPDETIDRTLASAEAIDKLERFEGHLMNWYDISTLQPLYPRYISTVDTGNLLGSLQALDQGLQDLLNRPLLDHAGLRGLVDVVDLVRRETPDDLDGRPICENGQEEIYGLALAAPATLDETIRRFRNACAAVRRLPSGDPSKPGGRWTAEARRQAAMWESIIERYLSWVPILEETLQGGLISLGHEAHVWRRRALSEAPSLRSLAEGRAAGLFQLVALDKLAAEINVPVPIRQWLDRLAEAVSHAQTAAGEVMGRADDAIRRLRTLSEETNMRFLYNADRRVFHIGYDVSERRMDDSYYDLLASEARLGSFVSVARGEVPVEHWWALWRPFGQAFGERPLLSWNGTMFEYMTPLILTRSYENSMLEDACRAALKCQIAYGERRGIPWGISEGAFSALDSRQVYQYRAFGVPGLGLKRGLEEDLVVTPYASALALHMDPAAATQNLRRLARTTREGTLGEYGFYESIDFTRQEDPHGARGVIVYCYMAHHQGMILLSIDNALNDRILQSRFHMDPRTQAAESLLHERIPIAPATMKGYIRDAPALRLTRISEVATTNIVDSPDTPTPWSHMLSNGAISSMVTSSGGGYCRWNDFEISRWRADTTRDCWGPAIYLKDVDSGFGWSAGNYPLRAAIQNYKVHFSPEKVEIRRRDAGIETILEVVVSPEDDAEIRRLAVVNHSPRPRTIEITSFIELALATHEADRAHPAFSKLFVETEALPNMRTLFAHRRPRSPEDPPVWAFHVLSADDDRESPVTFETDRERFIGRTYTSGNPAMLDSDLSGTVGYVLDPIFSLRRRVTLAPGERIHVCFSTGAGASREAVMDLAQKYSDERVASRAFDLAWTHCQLELRHLRIQPSEAQRFQQLASYVLYPSSRLRAPEETIRRNHLSRKRLWAYGISGDLPIVTVVIEDPHDLDPVRQAMMAHTFWRIRGLKVDLVIFNQEGARYDQPLQTELYRLVQAHSQYTGIEQPGGVFLRSVVGMPQEDIALFHSVSRVLLVAARGTIAQQLGAPVAQPALPALLPRAVRVKDEPSPPLPFMELPYFNGLGGFTADGREYAIYLGPNDRTPLPWVNVMSNPSFGALISESGQGFCWYGNSQTNRLTPWTNDAISDPAVDAIYIRDEEIGVTWTPTPLPIRENDAYRCRHGQGYTIFEHNSHSIGQELTIFVPVDSEGGLPVRVQRLRLYNHSSRRRRLTVTSYCELALGANREESQINLVTYWDPETRALFARNADNPDYGERIAFSATIPPSPHFTADRTEFIGRNGSPASPAAINRTRLSGRVGAALDPCAALQLTVEMEPNQVADVAFLLGQSEDAVEAREQIRRLRTPGELDRLFAGTKGYWDEVLGAIEVSTPDLAVDFMLNRWLLYQVLSCRVWGRSAFYQSGGAFGFRDQLQDVLALVYGAPHIARAHILKAAARQFEEGDVQHWWHDQTGAGVRTRISDDLLWLPFVIAQYVRETGDNAILDEPVHFLHGKPLEPGKHETYGIPDISSESDTLLEHCRRAIAHGATEGPNGLPLIGGGDWNDGLNRMGIDGRGESVWLGWFLVRVLKDFAELLLRKGDRAGAKQYRTKARRLAKSIEHVSWDGEWYLRGFFDDGTPLGSSSSEEARIDSLPQSWAIISGEGDPKRSAMSMKSVLDQLLRSDEKLLLLFSPPFDKTEKEPGYIKGYPPGVRENGGQYTHGSLWVPFALARLGHGETAIETLRLMNPVEHARQPDATRRYKVEPYVVAADIYALEGREGRGGWTWYTGAAGWMYRTWLEEVLGFRLQGNRLRIQPSISREWRGFSITYRYGSTRYFIEVQNPDGVSFGIARVELNGSKVPGNVISLTDDGEAHNITVLMGAPLTESTPPASAPPGTESPHDGAGPSGSGPPSSPRTPEPTVPAQIP